MYNDFYPKYLEIKAQQEFNKRMNDACRGFVGFIVIVALVLIA